MEQTVLLGTEVEVLRPDLEELPEVCLQDKQQVQFLVELHYWRSQLLHEFRKHFKLVEASE